MVIPVGNVCRVAIYEISSEEVNLVFTECDTSYIHKILYDEGLCVVTCDSHTNAKLLKEHIMIVYGYQTGWYVDADQTIEYSEEEPENDLGEEGDYDVCICGDYLDVYGHCRECHIGLGGINQFRF